MTDESRLLRLADLLELLEAHIACPLVQRYGDSEGPPPERPRGWTPPPPEPDCGGQCPPCPNFGRGCTLRELADFREWERLRRAYPELRQLEHLHRELMYQHANWASALYWVYVQPWDAFERDRREEYARLGLEWMSEHFVGEVPEAGERPKAGRRCSITPDSLERAVQLRADGLSLREIGRRLGVSKDALHRVLKVRRERRKSALG